MEAVYIWVDFCFEPDWNRRLLDQPASAKPTVKILKIGTPKTITIIVLQMEQLNFTVQNCVRKMQAD